ncbi:MAG: hypothetical protein ABI864_05980 [Chloroflexota bacterium]
MVLLIVLAVVVAIVLVKVISLPLALLAILVVIGFAAWRLDRGRAPGAIAPYLDANRPDFYEESSSSAWDVPTAYIDHPTGAGEPPGVDGGDEPAERR